MLIWNTMTGKREILPCTSLFEWKKVYSIANFYNSFVDDQKEYLMVVVKDKKVYYETDSFSVGKFYNKTTDIPVMLLVSRPTWHDRLIHTALKNSYSDHKALVSLLKSSQLGHMKLFVRQNVKELIRTLLVDLETKMPNA